MTTPGMVLDHDPAAEQAVVLCCMASPKEAIGRVIHADLTASAFKQPAYRAFVQAAGNLFLSDQDVNQHAINGKLLEMIHAGRLSESDYKLLVMLWNGDGLTISLDELGQHIRRVATFHTMRRAVEAADGFVAEVRQKPARINTILPSHLAELSAIAEGAIPEDPRPLEILARAKPTVAVPSGFQALDEEFGGWPRANVITWAAPSEHGKTAAGTSFTANLLAQNTGVLYLTPELPGRVIIYRILCNLCNISIREAEQGGDTGEVEKIRRDWLAVLNENLRVYERVYTVTDAVMRIRWHKQEFGDNLGLVVLDHLHFMRGLKQVGDSGSYKGNSNAYWREVMQRFTDAAKTYDIPLLLFSQLSLEMQRKIIRDGDVDVLSFKESGDIFDASDIAWVMWRHPDIPNKTVVNLKKNRLRGIHRQYVWSFDPVHYRLSEE